MRDTCTSRQRDRQTERYTRAQREKCCSHEPHPTHSNSVLAQVKPNSTAQRICNANKMQIQGHPLSLQLGTRLLLFPTPYRGTEHILILVCSECSWQQLRNYGVLSRHLTPHLQSFVVLIVCPRPHPPHHVCPSVRPACLPALLPVLACLLPGKCSKKCQFTLHFSVGRFFAEAP